MLAIAPRYFDSTRLVLRTRTPMYYDGVLACGDSRSGAQTSSKPTGNVMSAPIRQVFHAMSDRDRHSSDLETLSARAARALKRDRARARNAARYYRSGSTIQNRRDADSRGAFADCLARLDDGRGPAGFPRFRRLKSEAKNSTNARAFALVHLPEGNAAQREMGGSFQSTISF
jgi:hypothetical protein